jgi:hypothetical protein
MYSRTGQYGACVLHSGYPRPQTHTQNMYTYCFPLQQWLLESASMLHYMHIAVLLIQIFFGVVSNSGVMCHLMGYFNSTSGEFFDSTSTTDCYC